jgi:hypothetical protein
MHDWLGNYLQLKAVTDENLIGEGDTSKPILPPDKATIWLTILGSFASCLIGVLVSPWKAWLQGHLKIKNLGLSSYLFFT